MVLYDYQILGNPTTLKLWRCDKHHPQEKMSFHLIIFGCYGLALHSHLVELKGQICSLIIEVFVINIKIIAITIIKKILFNTLHGNHHFFSLQNRRLSYL